MRSYPTANDRLEDSMPSGQSFRTAVDRLLLSMVGQVRSDQLRQLKYLLNKFEQHNISRLAQLNKQLAEQSELQLRLAAVDQLLETLDYKLVAATREGAANSTSLSEMHSVLQNVLKMVGKLSASESAMLGQRGQRAAYERLKIERYRFEAAQEVIQKGHTTSTDWLRCNNSSCASKMKQLTKQTNALISEICELEHDLDNKDVKLLECQRYILLLREQLNAYDASESSQQSRQSVRSQSQKSKLEGLSVIGRIEATVEEAVGRAMKSQRQHQESPPVRQRQFTLSSRQPALEQGCEQQSPTPHYQAVYNVEDGELLRIILAQACTVEELLGSVS